VLLGHAAAGHLALHRRAARPVRVEIRELLPPERRVPRLHHLVGIGGGEPDAPRDVPDGGLDLRLRSLRRAQTDDDDPAPVRREPDDQHALCRLALDLAGQPLLGLTLAHRRLALRLQLHAGLDPPLVEQWLQLFPLRRRVGDHHRRGRPGRAGELEPAGLLLRLPAFRRREGVARHAVTHLASCHGLAASYSEVSPRRAGPCPAFLTRGSR
jgi:hypothetical protein